MEFLDLILFYHVGVLEVKRFVIFILLLQLPLSFFRRRAT